MLHIRVCKGAHQHFKVVFYSKDETKEELLEVKKIELLLKVLFTQEQIYCGE